MENKNNESSDENDDCDEKSDNDEKQEEVECYLSNTSPELIEYYNHLASEIYYPYENLESVEDNEGAVIFSGGEIECQQQQLEENDSQKCEYQKQNQERREQREQERRELREQERREQREQERRQRRENDKRSLTSEKQNNQNEQNDEQSAQSLLSSSQISSSSSSSSSSNSDDTNEYINKKEDHEKPKKAKKHNLKSEKQTNKKKMPSGQQSETQIKYQILKTKLSAIQKQNDITQVENIFQYSQNQYTPILCSSVINQACNSSTQIGLFDAKSEKENSVQIKQNQMKTHIQVKNKAQISVKNKTSYFPLPKQLSSLRVEQSNYKYKLNETQLAMKNIKINFYSGLKNFIQFKLQILSIKMIDKQPSQNLTTILSWINQNEQKFRFFLSYFITVNQKFLRLIMNVKKLRMRKNLKKTYFAESYIHTSCIKQQYKQIYLEKIIKFCKGAKSPSLFHKTFFISE